MWPFVCGGYEHLDRSGRDGIHVTLVKALVRGGHEHLYCLRQDGIHATKERSLHLLSLVVTHSGSLAEATCAV